MANIGTIEGLLTLRDEFTAKINNAASQMQTAGRKMERIGQTMSDVGGKLTRTVTLPLVALGAGSVKVAKDFESSFAGIIKTVDDATDEFGKLTTIGKSLQQGMRDLSKEIPTNVNELNRIGEAAGQLGIKSENILQFTRTIADLGVTTNLGTTEAAESLAQFINIVGTSQTNIDRLGSVIAGLGNSLATNETAITEFGLRIAGAGKIAGLTEAQILSIGGAFASVGIEAEAGGTAVQKILISMTKAVAQGGEQLELFAHHVGLTTDEFVKAFQQDAGQVFVRFIKTLSDSGQDAFTVLDELGFSQQRVTRAAISLAGASDLLGNTIDNGTRLWEENNALTIEAERRYATFDSKLTVFLNKIKDVGITLGNVLIPILNNLLKALDPVIKFIASAAELFAKLPEPIQVAATAILALIAAIGPVLVIAGQVVLAFGAVSTALGAAGLTGALGTVVTFLTGPAGLIAAGVALLIAFKPTRDFFINLAQFVFTKVRDAISKVIEVSQRLWQSTAEGREFLAALGQVILKDLKPAFDVVVKLMRDHLTQHINLAKVIVKSIKQWDGWGILLIGLKKNITATIEVLKTLWFTFKVGINVLREISPLLNFVISTFERWIDEAHKLTRQTKVVVSSTDELGKTASPAAASVEEMNAAFEKLNTNTGPTPGALKEIREEVDKLTEAFREEIDKTPELEKRMQELSESYFEVSLKANKAGESTVELTKAFHEAFTQLKKDRLVEIRHELEETIKALKEYKKLVEQVASPEPLIRDDLEKVAEGLKDKINETAEAMEGITVSADEMAEGVREAFNTTEGFIGSFINRWKTMSDDMKAIWAGAMIDVVNIAADAFNAINQGTISTVQGFSQIAGGVGNALGQAGFENASQWAGVVSTGLRGLDLLSGDGPRWDEEGGRSGRQLTGGLMTAGAIVGGIFAGPFGAAIGQAAGEALGGLLISLGIGGSRRGFAGQNIGVTEGGGLGLVGGARGNTLGNFPDPTVAADAALGIVEQLNAVFDDIGVTIAAMNADFDIILQDGKGLVVNINGVQTVFGEDMQGALQFLTTEILKTADLAGLSVEATDAIQQAAAEAGDDFDKFTQDLFDIQKITGEGAASLSPIAKKLQDAFDEFNRQMEQAARFGLDTSNLEADFSRSIEGIKDSLLSFKRADPIQAIVQDFADLMDQAIELNRILSEQGRLDELIDLEEIERARDDAIREEQRRRRQAGRQRAEQQAAEQQRIQDAIKAAQDNAEQFSQTLRDIINPTTTLTQQLRDLQEQQQQHIESLIEQGLATEDLTNLVNLATQALKDQARADFFSNFRDFVNPMGDLEAVFAENANRAEELKKELQGLLDNGAIGLDRFTEAMRRIDQASRGASQRASTDFATQVMLQIQNLLGNTVEAANIQWQLKKAELLLAKEQLRIAVQQGFLAQRVFDGISDAMDELFAGDNPFLKSGDDFADTVVTAGKQFAASVKNPLDDLVSQFASLFESPENKIDTLRNRINNLQLHELVNLAKRLSEEFGVSIDTKINDIADFDRIRDAILQLVSELEKSELASLADSIKQPFLDLQKQIFFNPAGPVSGADQFAAALSEFNDLKQAFESGDILALEGQASVIQQLLETAGFAVPAGSVPFNKLMDSIQSFLADIEASDFTDLLQAEEVQKTFDPELLAAVNESSSKTSTKLSDVETAVDDVRNEIRELGIIFRQEILKLRRT